MEKERLLLIAEDEENINKMLADYFEATGFRVVSAFTGKEALRIFSKEDVDLILLDVMLPGLDGFEVARQIRKESAVPILFLTARTDEGDRVLGLELGGDDYVTKPFSLKEVAARVRALIRRSYQYTEKEDSSGSDKLIHGDLQLDLNRRQLFINGQRKDLTSIQFQIMEMFLSQPGRVFSRMDLLRSFQEDAYEGYERTIDAHIKNLRKIVENDSARPEYIKTVWGQGYKLNDET